jgi:TolA-binding protein
VSLRGASLRFLGALSLVVCLDGCFWFTSRAQGDELRTTTTDLSKRVAVLEKQLESDRQEYTQLIQQADHDVQQIEEIIDTATKSAATYATDVANMQEQLARLEGGVAEVREDIRQMQVKASQREDALRDRVEQVAAKVGLDPPLDQTQIPAERDKLLAAADEAAARSQHGNARSLYRAFLERFPTDDMADDVQLKVGQVYAAEGRHAQALAALNVVVDRYPESNVMGETLYAMADSLFKMRSCNDAITLLQAVIQRYRDPALVKQAQTKLREVQRAKRRGCQP